MKEAIQKLQREAEVSVEDLEKTALPSESKRVHYPGFWKKKRLNPEFVKKLQDTANREPAITDDHGEYKEGVFLHGCYIVSVEIINDLWSLSVHGEHPVPLHVIREVRYKYLPDALLMTQLFPSRKEKASENSVVLYQIPGSMVAEKEEIK